MGVTNLWHILEPVKQHVPLSNLKGKTLAIDLSLWVCEAQTVKKMIGVVTKPHLRNLYFRVSFLTRMGIHLVFVMEGDPPKLKTSTMHKRTETRFGPSKKSARTGRSHFNFLLKECLEMLECLGVPWVQAAGEAEAMCAYLNANGYVDGCVTNDGDAFLYGAQTVYRNFTMDVKDPHVDCYLISAIKEKLGCSRESLIGLAILLGCDYLPKGIPGVGKEQALKLIRTLRGQSLLQRFEHWLDHLRYDGNPGIAVKKVIHCAICRHPGSHKDHENVGCHLCESVGYCEPHEAVYHCPCDWHSSQQAQQVDQVEDGIRKKAKACEGFPFPEVIQEYLISKDKQLKLTETQRPNLLSFQRFACEKMGWTKHYACEKLCPLLTYYDMNRSKSGRVAPKQLQALRIIKTRMKNGTPCFEIEWQKPDHFAAAADQIAEPFFITTEESSLFQAAYPEIVAWYQMQKLDICKEKKRGKKSKLRECQAEDSEVADLLSQLKLQSACEIFPDHESKLSFETDFNHQMLPENDSVSQGPTVTEIFSATVVKNQNTPFGLLITPPQNEGNECKSGSSQVDFINQPVDSYASSAIAGLQLSGIDWEGTSFSMSPPHVDSVCSEPESITCSTSIRQCSPLHHKTEIIAPYSDLVRLQNAQEMRKNLEILGQVAQKSVGSCNATPMGDCIETAESTCSTNALLRLPLIPAEALDNCEVRKHSVQTTLKSSLKKSVCQNGGSSEDSDTENMKKSAPCRGSKWRRKRNLLLLKNRSNSKCSNSESKLQIKLRGEEPDFQVISTNTSVKEHPKPSSVVPIHNFPSSTESVLSMSNPHLQESENDSEVGFRSPLPLSERLKLRLQSH